MPELDTLDADAIAALIAETEANIAELTAGAKTVATLNDLTVAKARLRDAKAHQAKLAEATAAAEADDADEAPAAPAGEAEAPAGEAEAPAAELEGAELVAAALKLEQAAPATAEQTFAPLKAARATHGTREDITAEELHARLLKATMHGTGREEVAAYELWDPSKPVLRSGVPAETNGRALGMLDNTTGAVKASFCIPEYREATCRFSSDARPLRAFFGTVPMTSGKVAIPDRIGEDLFEAAGYGVWDYESRDCTGAVTTEGTVGPKVPVDIATPCGFTEYELQARWVAYRLNNCALLSNPNFANDLDAAVAIKLARESEQAILDALYASALAGAHSYSYGNVLGANVDVQVGLELMLVELGEELRGDASQVSLIMPYSLRRYLAADVASAGVADTVAQFGGVVFTPDVRTGGPAFVPTGVAGVTSALSAGTRTFDIYAVNSDQAVIGTGPDITIGSNRLGGPAANFESDILNNRRTIFSEETNVPIILDCDIAHMALTVCPGGARAAFSANNC